MDRTLPSFARLTAALRAAPSKALIAGAIIIASPLAGAILFRTYGGPVTPPAWEMVRRFDLFFRFCELVVVGLACRAGFFSTLRWAKLARLDKAAVLVWLSTFWIGSALSQQPAYSLLTVSSWLLHGLFGIAVWHLARGARLDPCKATHLAGKGVAAALLGVLLTTIVHFLQTPDPARLVNGGIIWISAVPGFQGVRLFGIVMSYAALFGAGMLLTGQDPGRERIALALLILGFGAACWSGTRAALPAFFGALIIVPILARLRFDQRSWSLLFASLLAAFALAALIPVPDANFGLFGLFRSTAEAGGDVSAGRMDLWRVVWAAIVERPWFGHGEGATWWLLGPENASHVQPHNIVLQLALHWGALAACAMVYLGFRMYVCTIQTVRRKPVLLPFSLIVSAAPIAALFDGALYYPQMVMLPVAAMAFVLAHQDDGRVKN